MEPAAEHVHWMFAAGFLGLGVMMLAEAVVGKVDFSTGHSPVLS